MGMMVLMKKMQLGVMILFAASLMQTAFAAGRGGGSMVVFHTQLGLNQAVVITHQEEEDDHDQLQHHIHRESATIHERLLRVNARDYGSYDPPPSFPKPPYKLIPN